MKLQKAAHASGFARIIRYAVGRQPELAEPYVQKKNREKASEVEDVFFDGNRPAERGSADTQSRPGVGIVEEPLGENEVEQAAQRDEDEKGPPESAPRNFQFLAGQKPSCDEGDGEDEKQKAHGVAVRRGSLVDRNERDWGVDSLQRDGRRNHNHRKHGDDNPGTDGRAGESVRLGCGHERPPILGDSAS